MVNSTNFMCRRTASGRYALYVHGPMGKPLRVRGIGFSAQPFDIVAEYPGTPFVTVRHQVMTPRGLETRLFLVNTKTGKIPDQAKDGFKSIVFDSGSRTFYFSQSADAYFARYAQYMAMQNNGAVNIPALQYANTTTNGTPIAVMAPAPKPKRKRARGKRKLRTYRRMRGMRKQLRARTRRKRTMPQKIASRPAASIQLTAPYAMRDMTPIKYEKTIINGPAQVRTIAPHQISPQMLQMLLLKRGAIFQNMH